MFSFIIMVVLLLSSVMIMLADDPVDSLFWLVIVFLCGSGFFIVLQAQFLAMMLIAIYVGAITVLFLFIVMMLRIRKRGFRPSYILFLPFVGFFVCFAISLFIFILVGGFGYSLDVVFLKYVGLFLGNSLSGVLDSVDLGFTGVPFVAKYYYAPYYYSSVKGSVFFFTVIYTCFGRDVILAGLILFTAMVCAISLTIRTLHFLKRQSRFEQIMRHSML